jgi:magnesium transporter
MYIGKKSGDVAIEMVTYDADHVDKLDAATTSIGVSATWKGNLWVNMEGVHDPEKIEAIGKAFALHPLTIEDIMNTEQRPKLEDYGDYLYIVMKMLRYDAKEMEVESEQVSIVLGKNFVLCFQEGAAGDVFDSIRQHLNTPKSRVRQSGADFLCY